VKLAGGSEVTVVWAKLTVDDSANAEAIAKRADVTRRYLCIRTCVADMRKCVRAIVYGAVEAQCHEIGIRTPGFLNRKLPRGDFFGELRIGKITINLRF
jgi:hypothetical protein